MSSGLESLPEVPTGKTNGSAAETQGRFDYGMGDDKRLAIFDGSYRAGSKLLASRFGPKAGLALSLGGGFVALTIFTWLGAELLRTSVGPLVTALSDSPVATENSECAGSLKFWHGTP